MLTDVNTFILALLFLGVFGGAVVCWQVLVWLDDWAERVLHSINDLGR